MAETGGDITGNDDAISLRDFIRGHADHLDGNLHALLAQADRIEKHLTELTAQVAEVKPLLDRWKNSRVGRMIGGGAPWG